MNPVETIKMAFKAIWANKVRSFLTMLGVIIGVMSVTVLMGIGQGATASVTDSIASMGTNMLTVNIQTRRIGFGNRNNRNARSSPECTPPRNSGESPCAGTRPTRRSGSSA